MDLMCNYGGGGVESICMHMGLASLYFFFPINYDSQVQGWHKAQPIPSLIHVSSYSS